MNKEDILSKIETIQPKLQQWLKYKEASFEPQEITLVKELSSHVLPGRIINWGCPPCAGEVLSAIWSYYQREKNN